MAAGEPKELWLLPGMGHAEAAVGQELVDRIGRWIDQATARPHTPESPAPDPAHPAAAHPAAAQPAAAQPGPAAPEPAASNPAAPGAAA
jgi:hypothetical protein